MKASTVIIILIGLIIIILTLQHKKQSAWTDYAQGGFEAEEYIAGAEAIGTGALAKKNEEEEDNMAEKWGILEWLFNPKVVMIIFLFLIFIFGGGSFLFRNPILIFFAVIMFIVMRWRK